MGMHFKESEEKLTIGMIISGITIIAILVATLIVYWINAQSSYSEEDFVQQEQVGSLQEKEEDKLESVSIDIGKSVNEASSESNAALNNSNVSSKVGSSENTTTNTTTTNTLNNIQTSTTAIADESKKEEKAKDVEFTAPIQGEILKEFASDSLVYSDTLEEWVTHNGVDIKADKTSVVKAAANGTVFAIKNDPRYGLTVIVNHEGGYQTVYANLLTAEFVVEGEELEVGQTIGTVGNSATFEIADEYHLHFELIKNNEYLDPVQYMNF